jgi:lysophospholipase L1-like esterase
MPQVKLILIVIVLLLGWGVALKARRPVRGGQRGGGFVMGRPEARWLALGDSYTIGESVGPEERYPQQVRRLLEEKDHLVFGEPEIIAVTGWTTGDLLEAVSAAKGGVGGKGEEMGGGGGDGKAKGAVYDVVSLLIGVNNQFQGRSQGEYREQFELLLQKCIRLAGNRPGHVMVVSIPDYSVMPFGREGDAAMIAAQIDSFNYINFELARKYGVNYVDVTAESRKAASDPSLIAMDGLHFSGKEYAIWARLMEPVVKVALK